MIVHHLAQPVFIDASGKGIGAIVIRSLAGMALHPIIDQGIARAGIEGENVLSLAYKGNIGNPADIEKRQGADRDRCGESSMINRNERCALASRGDIGGAEITDDGHAKLARKQRTVAQLNGEALGRAMKNGLAMKADHVDLPRGEPHFETETLDSGRVPIGEVFFKLSETARTGVATGKGFRLLESLDEACPLAALIGIGERAATLHEISAVGHDLRDVDPGERRAAHQAQRSQLVRHSRPSNAIRLALRLSPDDELDGLD